MTYRGPNASGITVAVRRPSPWPLLALLAAAAALAGWYTRQPAQGLAAARVLEAVVSDGRPDYAAWARTEFERRYPGEKPANWAVAEAAASLSRHEAMGRFRLAVEAGQEGNDCSDFVACAVDEGLGVGSRLSRRETEHLYGEDPRLFETFVWRPGLAVQPGDIVSVRHSPWYAPYAEACWHCGIVGPDGRVLDFTKLRRWNRPRYGANSLAWFVRHSGGLGQVIVQRLRPEYRYRMEPLPEP